MVIEELSVRRCGKICYNLFRKLSGLVEDMLVNMKLGKRSRTFTFWNNFLRSPDNSFNIISADKTKKQYYKKWG